jgi:hypothetical protein
LDNLDRRFDPTYTSGAYYPNVLPMRRVRISSGFSYAGRVLLDDPVGYWRLGESAGTSAADSSGNGFTGTYIGVYTLAQAGALVDTDTSVSFGTTGRVTVAHNASLSIPTTVSVEILGFPNGHGCWLLCPDGKGQSVIF